MKKIILILVAVLTFGMANAQEDSAYVNRKKVAVVLSGGGAKGMAHMMGSIIGGLYAIGYNANALDSMVRVQDWGYVISDKEDLRNQSISDRKKQNTYFVTTGMRIGKKDANAGGIIKGKNLAELFQKLCVGYTDSLDFSKDRPAHPVCLRGNRYHHQRRV